LGSYLTPTYRATLPIGAAVNTGPFGLVTGQADPGHTKTGTIKQCQYQTIEFSEARLNDVRTRYDDRPYTACLIALRNEYRRS
jgi:hypothetical protein